MKIIKDTPSEIVIGDFSRFSNPTYLLHVSLVAAGLFLVVEGLIFMDIIRGEAAYILTWMIPMLYGFAISEFLNRTKVSLNERTGKMTIRAAPFDAHNYIFKRHIRRDDVGDVFINSKQRPRYEDMWIDTWTGYQVIIRLRGEEVILVEIRDEADIADHLAERIREFISRQKPNSTSR